MTRRAGFGAPVVIGVDLGSSAVKALVVAADGRVLATARAPVPTSHPAPGLVEQDPRDWYGAMSYAVRRAVAESGCAPEQITALGMSGFAHAPVFLGAAGGVVRPSVMWSDSRSVAEVRELEKELGDDLRRATLNDPSPTWTLPQLRWVARYEPDSIEATKTLLIGKDALVYYLTGERVTDRCSAASTMMFDAQAGEWNSGFAAAAGIRADQLPSVVGEFDVVGTVLPSVAGELGVATTTLVVSGSLDSTMELIGLGVADDGDGAIRMGTAGGAVRLTSEPGWRSGTILYPHPAGLWQRQCFSSNVGGIPAWGAALLGLDEPAGSTGSDSLLSRIEQLAGDCPPGSDGVLFHPFLTGERAPLPSHHVRGTFVGLSVSHGRSQLARAMLEGVAFTVRSCFAALWPANSPSWLAAAGGAMRSGLWSQMVADVLGMPIHASKVDASALGAAMVAGTSADVFSDLDHARAACVSSSRIVVPDATTFPAYAEAFERFGDWSAELYQAYENHSAAETSQTFGA